MLNVIPPIFPSNEPVAKDYIFEEKCINFIESFLLDNQDAKIIDKTITNNEKFGLVCRIYFATPDDGTDTQNIILLWKLQNGELAEFIGLEVQSAQLR